MASTVSPSLNPVASTSTTTATVLSAPLQQEQSAVVSPRVVDRVILHYGPSTYIQRLRKFLDLTNPRHLLHTKTEIQRCQAVVRGTQESGKVFDKPSYQDFRRCQSIVNACVHPTTQQCIPWYGRMAAFTPLNVPISTGLLLTSPTLTNVVAWQAINQTYNAVFNHCNAAKSNTNSESTGRFTQEQRQLLRGYVSAVFVSVGLAVGLTRSLKRAKLSPAVKSALQAVVPYTAVASAGVANVGFMRMNELYTGLPVKTPDGVYVGHSRIAARKALMETMVSRALLPFPILLLPPPLIALALRWRVLQANRVLKTATELTFLTLGIAIGFPMAIAVFPQTSTLALTEIEPELEERAKEIVKSTRDESVEGHLCVVFNRGV